MVVFTCGHCGESVQKPKVEKHYTTTKCRNRTPNLSCMDCFKDFLGTSYEEHTKCVTEEERYSAKGFVAKEKKGEKKQNTWVDLVQSVLDEQKDAPRNVLRIIENISKHQNTPRKKPKFINFVKNVCGHKTNPADIDRAWDLISVKLSSLSNANNRNQNQVKSDIKEESNDADKNGDETEGKQENGKENGHSSENGEESQGSNGDVIEEVKLSKKQLKEKKKNEKYQAELQKAETAPEEEPADGKKKKKNRTKSMNAEDDSQESKKNKRKRQDTVNSVNGATEVTENGAEPVMNGAGKPQKKKGKLEAEEVAEEISLQDQNKSQKKKGKLEAVEVAEEICLHDQNVAKIGELVMSDKFNWHAVILSVLEKKGNELPFKRLQKKVLGEYSEATGREVDDRIADKFIKKLKSLPNVRVDKNRVLVVD